MQGGRLRRAAENDRQGQNGIRRFINLYVNGETVRCLDGLKTGDELTIVPAVAGG